MGISCFIICFNEEGSIRRCLDSVSWCDEIVVIDSGSTDRTLEICAEYTRNIHHREWSGYVNQKRAGLELCTQEWVLNVDADEEVSPALQEEILAAISPECTPRAEGFYISRVVFYLGRWWRRGSWYPEYRLRLCKRACTTWGGSDPHEKALVKGKTSYLKGELFHYTYKNIEDQVERLNSHSSSAALSLFRKNEDAGISKIVISPLIRFIKAYIIKLGCLEGYAGLLVALLEAYYTFLKYMKLWELRKQQR